MRWALLAAVVASAVACSKAGEESKTKRAPVPPPPVETSLPDDLRIEVEIDGEAAEPITAERLAAVEPHYADEERRAWRLTALLGDVAPPGTTVEALGRAGVGITMQLPSSAEVPQPVLFLTRRGDVVAAVIDPSQPFPTYHGSGGRLKRPGDPRPRITPVTSLRVKTD